MDIRDDKQTNDELVAVFAKARDEYRKASSYRIEGYSSSLQPLKDKVVLTDIESPRSERVSFPPPWTELAFGSRQIERGWTFCTSSERGLPVLRFDSSMRPTVTRDFYPYLVGDKVDVEGNIRQVIRRPSGNGSSTHRNEPSSPINPSVKPLRRSLLKHEHALGAGVGTAEREESNLLPAKVVQAARQALGLVATNLVHTKLFPRHARKLDLGDELKTVAPSERTITSRR